MPILAHLDLDAFFAAVEELEDPALRRRPLVVGGDPRGRGVVATANYVARRFGIRSAMSAAEALRRCPDAVFLRPRHALYRQYSQAVWSVIREVVPVLQEIGDEQEQAARSLGASATQTFLRVTLPAIRWGVVYGVVLSLARSLGEFGAVKVVSGNVLGSTRTATLVVEEKYLNFDKGGAFATAFLLALVAVAVIVAVVAIRPSSSRPEETR